MTGAESSSSHSGVFHRRSDLRTRSALHRIGGTVAVACSRCAFRLRGCPRLPSVSRVGIWLGAFPEATIRRRITTAWSKPRLALSVYRESFGFS